MAEPEIYSPEVLAEEEPRYLRRQKPIEIKRRKFGKRQWLHSLKVSLIIAASLGAGGALYVAADFALNSPQFRLVKPEQIETVGLNQVTREAVLEKFLPDRNRSALRVPLDERRRQIEEIQWVESARVARILPNRLRVEVVERTPVAFLRQGSELELIDAYGVILERPLQGNFQFPVVTGIAETAPREDRERQMKLFLQFLKEIELARAGASAQVSETDLSDLQDVRATLAGLPELGNPAEGGQGTVLVHFGAGDFQSKFQAVIEHLAEWRASAGRVESVDLRFERQVVVNPEAQAASSREKR